MTKYDIKEAMLWTRDEFFGHHGQEDQLAALEAENADLRSGEYLARVIEERDRYRKALEQIAAYDDKQASEHLQATGDYGGFDEPGSVSTARNALESTNEPT